jgi:pimeloyl-ACP methyl ester carboxylesterase
VKVLLLHAFPLDPGMWEAQRPLLASYETVAPRIYGRGNSMDAWASSILDEVDGSFVAVGASMGGGCALAMARRKPERVEAIVLSGAHAGPDAPDRRPQREETIGKIRAEGAASVWQGAGPPPSDDDLIAVVEALRDRPDDRAVVASLHVPLLVAVGDADPTIAVEAARALAGSAPAGTTLEVISGAGHLVSLEQPEAFNTALGRFLERV